MLFIPIVAFQSKPASEPLLARVKVGWRLPALDVGDRLAIPNSLCRMESSMFARDTVIAVMPLTHQKEGNEIIIGNPETGTFLAVSSDAAEVLNQLAQGKSVGQVSDLYQQKYGEKPDLDHLLSILQRKGLVGPTGEHSRGERTPARAQQLSQPRYHFSNFPQPVAHLLFSRPVIGFYSLIVGLALTAIYRDPELRPAPADLFFPDHRALSCAVLIVFSYAAIVFHELAHLIATRAVGVNSRIGIGHRLWYAVAETDLTGLWAVPKRQRYLPMLAGILIDATSAATLVLLLFARRREWLVFSSVWMRLVRGMVFTYLMGIAWQFFLFVRTDLYYVIATVLNCRNLLGDTQVYLRNQLARIIPSVTPKDQSAIPRSERQVIRAYAVFWIAGRIWAVYVLLLVTLPVGVSYIQNLGAALKTGYSSNPSDFTDALVTAACFLVPIILGFMLWIGALLRRERI
jgi:putative peptide zinc metalloprotease protein